MPLAIPVTLLVLALTLLLPSFLAFDRLVRLEHDSHLDAWEEDGRPNGMFWRAPGSYWSQLRSGFASNRCMFVWLFRTPQWTRGDDQATHLLRTLRWFVLAWNLAMLIFIPVTLHGLGRL